MFQIDVSNLLCHVADDIVDGSHVRCKVEGGRKPFGTMEGLKCHVRSDTEERPHICPQQGCGKAFKAFGDLQKHKYRHTGE